MENDKTKIMRSHFQNIFSRSSNGYDPFLSICAFRTVETNSGLVEVDFLKELHAMQEYKPRRKNVKYDVTF